MIGKRMFKIGQIKNGTRYDHSLERMRKLTDKDKNIAAFMRMQGVTSTSESYKVALNQARTEDNSMDLVLFVFCIQNYWQTFGGFRNNTQLHSAHHNEQEVLLMDGIPVTVISTEKMTVSNQSPEEDPYFWNYFNGKSITVFYLISAYTMHK